MAGRPSFSLRSGHVAAMEFLLAHDADKLADDEFGRMAFHDALTTGGCPMAVVLALLAAGAVRLFCLDIRPRTSWGVGTNRLPCCTSDTTYLCTGAAVPARFLAIFPLFSPWQYY